MPRGVPHDALVMVGDGGRALFFRNVGSAEAVKLAIENVFHNPNPATREQGTDSPGRVHASVGARRSAMEPTDWHRLAERDFAGEIAGALYRQAHRGAFERLVVVAPPRVLGELRKSAHSEVADRIVAEIPKDLTSHPIPEIERALAV